MNEVAGFRREEQQELKTGTKIKFVLQAIL